MIRAKLMHIKCSLLWKLFWSAIIFGVLQSCTLSKSTASVDERQTRSIGTRTPPKATAGITWAPTEPITPSKTPQQSCGDMGSVDSLVELPNQERGISNLLILEIEDDKFTYWIIDLNDGSKIRFVKGFTPLGWSPSGQQLLLYQDKEFFLASQDGSDPKLIFSIPVDYALFDGWWLNESCLVLNISYAPDDPSKQFDPRVYLLDLDSGSSEIIMADEPRIVQSVSHKDRIWVQGAGSKYELCNAKGACKQVLQEYTVISDVQPKRNSRITFVPATGEIVFFGTEKTPESEEFVGGIYKSTIINQQISTSQLLYQPTGLYSMKISPNSRFIAFAEEIDYTMVLTVLNLESLETMTFEPWKEIISYPLEVTWSPDSSSIALSFIDQGVEVLAVIELASGQITPVYKSTNSVHIISWPNIELD